MKGPSLDAIRKFKEQQERKKRDEEEKKVQEKLVTLEHRAAQGDKRAKSQLKQIERVKEERKRTPNGDQLEHRRHQDARHANRKGEAHSSSSQTNKSTAPGPRKPKVAETDFEELMRLAKNNTNEVRVPDKAPKQQIRKVVVRSRDEEREPEILPRRSDSRVVSNHKRPRPTSESHLSRDELAPRPSASRSAASRPVVQPRPVMQQRPAVQHRPVIQHRVRPMQPPVRHGYYRDEDDYDYEDEDEYESDGFVVNEEDDEVQDELQQTLKNVFRYDKRRCDLRERELDRQYRAIGNVSTFEDLEREERRASRLAASEDARAQREEDERRQLKKMRRKGLLD